MAKPGQQLKYTPSIMEPFSDSVAVQEVKPLRTWKNYWPNPLHFMVTCALARF
jgi:hypothetical protein